MNSVLRDFCNKLDKNVDTVRQLSKDFCETLNLSGFAYVRVYHDGRVGWVTSDSDHDRLLIDSGAIEEDPLLDTAELLREGRYLWFHDREFPGCEDFYRNRSQKFGLDHGLVIVNHHQDYLETGCFSGLLSKRPLYNLFMNETGLFRAFLEHFTTHLTKPLISLLEDGLMIEDLKSPKKNLSDDDEIPSKTRAALIAACGWSNLLKLSPRETECLALVHQNLTHQQIGDRLQLSPRTIEHYLESVKIKLDINTRAELHLAAQKIVELGFQTTLLHK